MKFDVVITTYKRPELVREAILSCLHQGPLLGRVIVVDDASNDDTQSVVRSIRDPRIIYIERIENGGIAAARRDGFARSDADWTISLDSDHEMLPECIEAMARLLASAESPVDILGGRYRWDTGGVTPVNVPKHIIGYRERIQLSTQPDGIGGDFLCAISKCLRDTVKWEPLRAGLPDILFQLDIAKAGKAIFTEEILALQKTCGGHGWTRGSARERWKRRCTDAADGIMAMNLILERHGEALRSWGKPLLARLYSEGAFYLILCGRRRQARLWLQESTKIAGPSIHTTGLGVLSFLPYSATKLAYRFRG